MYAVWTVCKEMSCVGDTCGQLPENKQGYMYFLYAMCSDLSAESSKCERRDAKNSRVETEESLPGQEAERIISVTEGTKYGTYNNEKTGI